MKTINITLDNREFAVPAGSTVLDAAHTLDIVIPTLCFLNGFEQFTSCMVCVVLDLSADRLIPSCSMPVYEGMRIETDNDRIRQARKDALDLLLSEHVGDCEAPCQRACPAHMDIPQMIRQIEGGQLEDALVTVKRDIPLPGVLGRICPAPCEKACNRRISDSSVSICSLKRHVADVDLVLPAPYRPKVKASSNKRVAIVGAGPTGLSAAYYLQQEGHSCEIFDHNSLPGGELRSSISKEVLPEETLDREIERITELGVVFNMKKALGRDIELVSLKKEYDAVILAIGSFERDSINLPDIEFTSRGIKADRKTYETSCPGIFAGGNAVSESQMAVRAVAQGHGIAESVNQMLTDLAVSGISRRFNSILGKISEAEAAEFMKEAQSHSRIEPRGGVRKGLNEQEAIEESSRCFRCDCRKLDSCRLRSYSDEYSVTQNRFKLGSRKPFQKIIQHDLVIYEPGKCIKCGLCVQITKTRGEKIGLSFVNRGFDVQVKTPFSESLGEAIKETAGECVAACPTAALSWRKR
ncbi:2Fe-2S iron-sulfur cluster-binding protein [Acidobacteriota bacterium]